MVWADSLEKEMATNSSIVAWKIPWREKPGKPVTKSQTLLSDQKKRKIRVSDLLWKILLFN